MDRCDFQLFKGRSRFLATEGGVEFPHTQGAKVIGRVSALVFTKAAKGRAQPI
jgi:hypothetical protein